MMAKVPFETMVVTLIKVQTAMEAVKVFVEDNAVAVMVTVALWQYTRSKIARLSPSHPNQLEDNSK